MATSAVDKKRSSRLRQPGPNGHWLLGCMRQFQREPIKFYTETWREYGDYVRIRILPGMYFHLLTHPDAVEHVLQRNHKNYRKMKNLIQSAEPLMGNGLFSSEGSFWLEQRRLAQPAFHRHQLMALTGNMASAADALIADWEKRGRTFTLDVAEEMTRWTLRVVSTSLFSRDISGEADTCGKAIRTAFEYISLKMNGRIFTPRWLPTERNRQFARALKILDDLVFDLIETRRRNPIEAADLLGTLIAARDEESGRGMSDRQLRDEVLTLLVAGHDTVGAALSWSWHLLGNHPEIQESLADEARGQLGGRTPTYADMPNLPLAKSVFEEALRLYPPAWGIPREAIEDDEIHGYAIPAASIITVNQYITHRHPAFWEDPEAFRPERFLGNAGAGRPKFAYFPFGGGPRICIGNTFALIEGPLCLAALAQRFRMTPVPGHDVEMDPTFTLRPKSGVPMNIAARS